MVKNYSEQDVLQEVDRLMDQSERMQCQIIFVTNEVGAGIVPDNKLARDFRDLMGSINQRVAQRCDEVIHMVSGIPMTLK